jgi:trigger factor
MSAGDTRTFSLRFPDDYHGKSVAGKEASFSMALKNVDEARLPEIDADFAKSLGVADGDVDKMRAEVRANVEREVKKRTDARLKNQVMDALLAGTPLELPKALIEMEARGLLQRAAQDLQSRGVKPEQINLTPQQFEETAKRRVALGLIIAELARAESLQPKPAEVRALVEQEAQSYESPAEVVKWFYMQRDRLAEMEAMALEANVVKWVLSRAQVKERDMAFDELMGAAGS